MALIQNDFKEDIDLQINKCRYVDGYVFYF